VGLLALHIYWKRDEIWTLQFFYDVPLQETTSFGPPGIFRPSMSGPRRVCRQWAKVSFEKFAELARGPDAAINGVQMVSGFQLSDNLTWLKDQEAYYSDIVLNFRWLTDTDLSCFNQVYRHGIFYTTFTAEGQIYTPWLLEKAKSLGAKFVERKITDLTDLANEYDVVINCTGLRSANLTPDRHVRPQRGVLLQVKAPWIKHFVYDGNDETFICPGVNTVHIGTVRQIDDWRTHVDDESKEGILKRCSNILPSIKDAPIVKEWAGLRPYRMNPRCEREIITTPSGRKFPVIHNYGHGGNGFVMSWGCAQQVASLMDEYFKEKSKL